MLCWISLKVLPRHCLGNDKFLSVNNRCPSLNYTTFSKIYFAGRFKDSYSSVTWFDLCTTPGLLCTFILVFQISYKSTVLCPSLPGQERRGFRFPRAAARRSGRELPYPVGHTVCLLCSRIDDLQLVVLGFLRTVSNPLPNCFISSLVCKIPSRKTNIDIKTTKATNQPEWILKS